MFASVAEPMVKLFWYPFGACTVAAADGLQCATNYAYSGCEKLFPTPTNSVLAGRA
jgi:hypothetical protein